LLVHTLSPAVTLLFFQSSHAHPFKTPLCDSELEHDLGLSASQEGGLVSSLDHQETGFS